jgi:hypothetical protein
MAGIRTAAIWVIGAATLSTPIGQTSLGNYIFTGLQTQNWVFVLFGCVAAAVFALAVDQLLALMEFGLTRRKRGWIAAGGLGLLLLTAGALVPILSQPRAQYTIGAKPFTEQYVLAALIEQRLRAGGWSAATREGLGSSVIFNALRAGEIDAYVDYSGTIWTNQMHRNDVKPRAEVLAEVAAWSTGSKCWAASASRTPMRWPCRAPERLRSASARWPISRAARPACRSPAITSSSAGRNGTRSARPTASISASSARCSRSSCTRPRRTARST